MRTGARLLPLLFFALASAKASAYEVSTHRALTNAAIDHQQASLEQLLAALGLRLSDNVTAYGRTQSLRLWIVQGSDEEDSLYLTRAVHHFHNPIDPLSSAGLRVVPTAMSSIAWMLLPADRQNPGTERANMSWNDARLYYRRALVSAASADRERYLALTVKAVGHAMHLVQDASVPSHVRDDAHLNFCALCGPDPDDFHLWMQVNNHLIAGLGAVDPSPSLLENAHSEALLPLANLIDANRYTNDDPELTLAGAGVAEVAHANFYSDDTIDDQPAFLHPSAPGSSDTPPGASGPSQQFFRLLRRAGAPTPSEYLSHLVLRTDVLTFPAVHRYTVEHPDVHRDYAAKLVPLAVGYSAAVPLWFFRSTIDAASVAGGAVRISNGSAEELAGSAELYVDDASGARSLVASWGVTLPPNGSVSGPPLTLSAAGRYTLVFLGRAGLESDAVAGRALFGVTVARAGTGSGRVTSSAIDCGATCTALASGGLMQLAAAADPGSVFDHWEGDCTGAQPSFTLTVDAPKSCTAFFRFEGKRLTIVRSGIGQGSVTSSPTGIACGTTCSAEFATGSSVTLTATPDAGSFFNGWRGACAGSSATTVVTLPADAVCEAIFDIPSVLLITAASCTITGNGSLSVSFQGINTGPYGSWDLTVTAFIFNGSQLAFFRPCSPLFDSSRVVYRRRADTRDWSGGTSALYCPKNSDPVRVLLQARTPFSGHNLSVDCH